MLGVKGQQESEIRGHHSQTPCSLKASQGRLEVPAPKWERLMLTQEGAEKPKGVILDTASTSWGKYCWIQGLPLTQEGPGHGNIMPGRI